MAEKKRLKLIAIVLIAVGIGMTLINLYNLFLLN